jgi:CBS domain-containing protein
MTDHADASCRSIMTANPLTLKRKQTVAEGLRLMLENRLLAIPIVDDDGRYFGMLGKSKIISLLLPRIVAAEPAMADAGVTLNFGFISETLDDARQRYAEVANHPVEAHAMLDTPVLRPDTSLMNALLFLYRARNFLPVVDEENHRLVGVVSTWDALARVARITLAKA